MNWDEFTCISWNKRLRPVIAPGQAGSWDDYASITPSIWPDKDGRYYILYTGLPTNSKDWGIGLAASDDLLNWQKIYDEPVIRIEGSGLAILSIDGISQIYTDKYNFFFESKINSESNSKSNRIILPTWLKKHLVAAKMTIKDTRKISMAVEHAKGRKIWHFSSPVLDRIDVSGSRIVFESAKIAWEAEGVFSPRVFDFDGTYYLIYGGSDGTHTRTGIAVGKNMTKWQRCDNNPVLVNGSNGQWDSLHALIVDIIRIDDGYVAFYEGQNEYNRYSIGIAFSKDLYNWKKFENNPIIEPGTKYSRDARMVCCPRSVIKDNNIYLFYTAHDRFMKGTCSLAIGSRISS